MGEEDHAATSHRWTSGGDAGLLATLMEPETSSSGLYLLPFGIPTLIIAEDPQLRAAARAAYAHWLVEAPLAGFVLELELETDGTSTTGVCLDIRVEGSRLTLRAPGIEGAADASTGIAHAKLPQGLAEDRAGLSEITDTLLLFMLARRGRTPVHASAFMAGDLAIVLAGPSGSGKSTLALAAAERGLPILSDDMVFVQREPVFTLWGFPRPIHVFEQDAPGGEHQTRLRNAKRKAIVETAAVALKAEKAVLVLIEQGERLDLARVEPEAAAARMMNLDPGFDLLETESRAAIAELASLGAWRLTLEQDPRAAISFLMDRLAAG